MMDEILDNTHATDFDELIKDLLESNQKALAESTGGNSNTPSKKLPRILTEVTESDSSPWKNQVIPRYTEAVQKAVGKLTLAPTLQKKSVRFA